MARSRRRALQAGIILILLAGLALGILYLLAFTRREISPVQWVGVGITAYDELPPRPGSRRDVLELQNLFAGLHAARPNEFSPVIRLEDNLTRDSLKKELSRQLAGQKRPIILAYLSLHALVTPESGGELNLAAIHAGVDALQGNDPSQLIPAFDLISSLLEFPARQVVVLVDAGRTDPNVRLGIIGRDAVEVLKQWCDRSEDPRLHVLCACSPGQESWTSEPAPGDVPPSGAAADGPPAGEKPVELRGPRSAFGEAVEEALGGACDGWQPDRKANGVIDWFEFSSFVADRVRSKVKQEYGETQEVLVLGRPGSFDLMAVRQPKLEEGPADGPADAATLAGAEAAKQAGTSISAEKSAESPQTAAGERGKPDEKAASGPPLDPEGLRSRLDESWERLARIRSFSSASLKESVVQQQFLLTRAEQELAAGLYDRCHAALAGFDQLASSAGSGATGGTDAALAPISVLWATLDGASPLVLTSADRTRLSKMADDLRKKAQAEGSAPAGPAPEKPPDGPAPSPWKDPALRRQFGLWLWEDALKSGTAGSETAGLLAQLDRSGWPATEWPAELVMLQQVSEQATPEKTTLNRRFLAAVDRAHRVVPALWNSTEAFDHVQAQFSEAQRALLAAERWLLQGPCPERLVVKWLDSAEQKLDAVEDLAQAWGQLAALRVQLRCDWPLLAEWIAQRDESTALNSLNYAELDEIAKWLERNLHVDRALLERAAAHWPVAGTGPAGVDLKDQHLNLLRLIADVREIEDLLGAKADDSTQPHDASEVIVDEKIRPLLGQVTARRESLVRQFHDEVKKLDVSNPALADHRDARRLLTSGLLDPAERIQLRELLAITPSGSLSAAAAPASTTAEGLWLGFWSICSQELAGADESALSGLWTKWRELGKALAKPGWADIVARAELGREINQTWDLLEDRLVEEANRLSANQLAALVYGLPGHASLRLDPAFPLLSVAREQVRDGILSAVAASWVQRPYAGVLVEKLRQRGAAAAARPLPNWELPAELRCGAGRPTSLTLRTTQSAGAGELAALIFDGANGDASLLQNGRTVREGAAIPLSAAGETLEISMPSDVITPRSLGLALVAEDGFPFRIERLAVLPPFDPTQFSIEFVTASGQTVYPGRVGQELRSRFNLPPLGEASLKPVLVRPPGHPTKHMSVECYAGEPRSGKLLFRTEIDIPGDAARVDIAPQPMTPEAPATPPAAPPPAAPAGIEVSQGIIFRLVPDGQKENTFEFLVRPELWLPTQFIDVPRPVLAGNRLEIDIESKVPQLGPAGLPGRPAAAPAILTSPKVPVSIQLGPEWESLLSGGALLQNPALELGKSTQLFVTVDAEKFQQLREPVEFTLSVAGWPHAFRWRVRDSGIERVTETAVRIAAPAGDAVFVPPAQPGEFATPVRLEVYGEDLDLGTTEAEPWGVEFDVRLKTRQLDGPLLGVGDQWPLHGRLRRSVLMSGPQNGLWVFRTQVSDFESSLDLRGLGDGQYELVAVLTRNRQSVSTDRRVFARDSTPPKVEFEFNPPRPFHDFQRPLTVLGKATDLESRISKVRIGIDLDGDRKLAPNEPARETTYEGMVEAGPLAPPSNTSVRYEAKFDAKDLPQKAGRYALVLEAENRAGMPASAAILIDLDTIGTPRGQAKTGRLVVTFQGDTRVNLDLDGRKKSRDRTAQSVIFDDLPPGDYTLKWEAPITKREGSESVKIEAGKIVTRQLPVAR